MDNPGVGRYDVPPYLPITNRSIGSPTNITLNPNSSTVVPASTLSSTEEYLQLQLISAKSRLKILKEYKL